MSFSLLSPSFATSYLRAFEAFPATGEIAIPVIGASGRIRSETLSSSNAYPFVETAHRMISEFGKAPEAVNSEAKGIRWLSTGKGARPGVSGSSGKDGRDVELIRMPTLGRDLSLRAYVGFRGHFSEARIRESVTVERNSCHLVTVHQMRFLNLAISGIRELLGMDSGADLTAVALACARFLGLTPYLDREPACLRKPGGRVEWSHSGETPSSQPAILMWGLATEVGFPAEVNEDLSVFFHVSYEAPGLDDSAMELWRLAADWSGKKRL